MLKSYQHQYIRYNPYFRYQTRKQLSNIIQTIILDFKQIKLVIHITIIDSSRVIHISILDIKQVISITF